MEKVKIENVEIVLSHPDDLNIKWTGQNDLIRQIMAAATSRLLRRNGLLWIDFLQMLFRTGAASFSMG